MTHHATIQREWYEPYLAACNNRRFEDLARYVDTDVDGALDGSVRGLEAYVGGVRAVTDAFPDYRWTMQHLIVEGDWVAALVQGTGTHSGTFQGFLPTGRTVMVEEMVFYRVVGGKLVECRGDLDVRLRDVLADSPIRLRQSTNPE